MQARHPLSFRIIPKVARKGENVAQKACVEPWLVATLFPYDKMLCVGIGTRTIPATSCFQNSEFVLYVFSVAGQHPHPAAPGRDRMKSPIDVFHETGK
jgi:hypothetical protein